MKNIKSINNILPVIPGKDWIEWFIGFCDADSNFQVFPKIRNSKTKQYYNVGYGFHISLNIIESDFIQNIQSNLNNIGHIYLYPNKNEVRFSVTKLDELKWLVNNIFSVSPLVSSHQSSRYNAFKVGLLNNINRFETLEDYNNFVKSNLIGSKLNNNYFSSKSFDNWIKGFVNGEGCFHIDNNSKQIFYIEHTDQDCLIYIKNRFEFTPSVNTRESRDGRRQQTYVLKLSSKRDINEIKSFFLNSTKPYLLGNKLAQFEVWVNHKN
jgi:hypothetical protein